MINHIFSNKPKNVKGDEKEEYEFVVEYEIEFKKTKMMEFLNLNSELPDDVQAFFNKMDSN